MYIMYTDCSFLQHHWFVCNELGFTLYMYMYTAQFVFKSVYCHICIYADHIYIFWELKTYIDNIYIFLCLFACFNA